MRRCHGGEEAEERPAAEEEEEEEAEMPRKEWNLGRKRVCQIGTLEIDG